MSYYIVLFTCAKFLVIFLIVRTWLNRRSATKLYEDCDSDLKLYIRNDFLNDSINLSSILKRRVIPMCFQFIWLYNSSSSTTTGEKFQASSHELSQLFLSADSDRNHTTDVLCAFTDHSATLCLTLTGGPEGSSPPALIASRYLWRVSGRCLCPLLDLISATALLMSAHTMFA